MHPAEVIVRHVQADRGQMVCQFLGEAVRQAREPTRAHAHRKIAPLDIASRNVHRIAVYGLPLYSYNRARRVPAGRVNHRLAHIPLDDLAVYSAPTKGTTDRRDVGRKTIGGDFRVAQDANRKVLAEFFGDAFGALAHLITDDGLRVGRERDEDVLIASGVPLAPPYPTHIACGTFFVNREKR